MHIQNTLLNSNSDTNFVLVRSEVLYYLKFINYDKDLFKEASNFTSKPTITYYTENSVNKVIIDYSFANSTDKKYLVSFFANMTQVDTFSMSSAEYLDASDASANLQASYTFTQYKDNKIFATVNSVTSQNSALDVYFGEYFIETPQITKTGNLGSSLVTENYALISVNPNTDKTLSGLGVIPGDFLEIVKAGSANNGIKYEIHEITSINNKEVIRLKPYNGQIPVTESLIGSAAIVNVYVKGTLSFIEEEINSDLGCCSSLDGTVQYGNQTRHQCRARSQSYVFTPGNCTGGFVTTSSGIQASAISTEIEKNIYLSTSGTVNSGFRANLRSLNVPVNVLRSVSYTDETGVINNSGYVDLQKGVTYYFIQNDPSNNGLIFRISKSDYTMFEGDVISTYTQTGIGSTITFYVDPTITETNLSLVCISDNTIIPLKINIV